MFQLRTILPACLKPMLRALVRPSWIAATAAVLLTALATMTGALDPLEQRLSDAWFGAGSIAPSGRIVLVTFDRAAARYTNTARLPRRDLADLLLRLDAAGASRILIEVGLGDLGNEAEDRGLERALAQVGRNTAITATALRASNQTGWRRAGPLDRFARHVTRTASDLALDSDGKLRRSGIESSTMRQLPSAPAWLAGVGDERSTAASGDPLRIDFAIDVSAIPKIDAASMLQGETPRLSGSSVIVSGFAEPGNVVFRVPRYGELTRSQITALAAETLVLDRKLQPASARPASFGLPLLAALFTLLCTRLGALAGAGISLCAMAGTAAAAAALQTSLGLMTPAAGILTAFACGYVCAQLAVHAAFERARHAVMAVIAGIDVKALHRVASEDPLTGLANRRAFEAALSAACASGNDQLALLLCDLDGFKQVNDTLGHAAGDTLLREIAARLSEAAKPNALVARLGGDEFAILLREASQPLAAKVAQTVIGAIARPIRIGQQSVAVGVSIGIALGEPREDGHALMASADAAMYEAKRSRAGCRLAQRHTAPAKTTNADWGFAEIRRRYRRAG
jgi:diguanylate cyclase (GGDEF)-like protein